MAWGGNNMDIVESILNKFFHVKLILNLCSLHIPLKKTSFLSRCLLISSRALLYIQASDLISMPTKQALLN